MLCLSRGRNRHIHRKHPDIPAGCFTRLGRAAGSEGNFAQQLADVNRPGGEPPKAMSCSLSRPRRRRGSMEHLKICSCNVDGRDNTYQFLQYCCAHKPHAIAVQETKVDEAGLNQLLNYAGRFGYRGWGWANTRSDRNRINGGLLILLRKDIRGHLLHKYGGDEGEAITLDLETCHLTNLWQRPQFVPQGGLSDCLGQEQMAARLDNKLWIGIGDFNADVLKADFPSENLQAVFASNPAGNPLPTRWSGQRAIDYAVIQGPAFLEAEATLDEHKFGDHKAVRVTLQLPSTKLPTHRIAKTADYSKPTSTDTQQWRDLLSDNWGEDEIPDTNTEGEWSVFCARAEAAMYNASVTIDTVSQGQCRPKGSMPRLAKPGSFVSYKESEMDFQQRSLSRFVGRLHELCRRVQAGTSVDRALDDTVRRTWPRNLPHTGNVLEALQGALAKRRRRKRQLSKWRHDMNCLGSKATKWVHNDVGHTPASLVGQSDNGETVVGKSVEENLVILRQFWRSIWRREGVCEELQRLRSGTLTCAEGAPLGDLFLEPEELMKAARRKSGGAAGLCGFHGDELCHWPLIAWIQLATLLRRWAKRQSYPAVWQQYRQVNLPKQNPSDGQLAAKHTRPISIQSAICRTIATALAQKDEVKQWAQQHVTPEVHGGVSGRGVRTAVLALASSFQHEHAVLLSLDMKKGYDYADPELVVGHLRRRGLPEHWCQYFVHVWMEQYRWLEWDNHVCPEPEFVSRSLPQGDPFAVLGFVLLLSEAASAARQNAPQHEVCALFVDDRTVVVREPCFLQGAFRFWTAWSCRLGFEENLDKLAIVCANPSDEEAVLAQGFEANAVVRQAKVLGVDFQQRGLDSEGSTAEIRRKDGLAILQRIRKAPVVVVTKEVLASTRALPRACWGVWFRQLEDSNKFGTQVKYAVQAHRNGSRNLWERGMRYWRDQGRQYQGGLWWISLVTSLRGLGFRYTDGIFVHGTVGRITWPPPVDADFAGWLERGRHLLREAFRRQHFQAFLDKDRRDSRQLRDVAIYEEERVTRARTLYRKTRHAGRAVMLGAAWSTLCYSRARGLADEPICRWCHLRVLATWHHLAWECEHFASTRPPEVPNDSLSLGLGWPSGRSSAQVLEHLATVREAVREVEGFRVRS